MKKEQILLSQVIFDETIYPRKSHDPSKVQEYAENLDSINKAENYIILCSRHKLLDGRHRHLAHLKNNESKDAKIFVYIRDDIKEDKDAYLASIKYNSMHGQQLNAKDKRDNAFKMYGMGYTVPTIAQVLSITERSVRNATKDIRDREKAERKEKIIDMYLACATNEEIAKSVGVTTMDVSRKTSNILENLPKSYKILATFQDDDFEIPIYNIWTFAKKTNEVSHFGNSEVRIVENLLYLYTKPLSIVVDPFAGGGSTINVCKKRLRRYYVSDRKPIIERRHEIRKLDIVDSLPSLNNRWQDVDLVYLDPPYWKQAENQYSTDIEDLANQSIEQFTTNLTNVVNNFASKMRSGSHIALIIQPTQWKSVNRAFTDHVFDICKGVENVELINRISAPYSTQQCTPQQVIEAKEKKLLLVLSREIIIWKVV